MPVAEQLTGPDAVHAEGPVWSPQWGGLRWVDMLAGDVLHLDESTGRVDRWHIGTVAAALRPREFAMRHSLCQSKSPSNRMDSHT